MSTNHEQSYLAHPVSLAAAAFCALTGCDKVWGSFIDELPPPEPIMCSPTSDPSPCPSGTTCSAATSTCVPTDDMSPTGSGDMAMGEVDMATVADMAVAPPGMIYMQASTFNVGATCGAVDSNDCHIAMNYMLPKSYWIDATEVTWDKYQVHSLACKDAAIAQEPKSRPGCTVVNTPGTDYAAQCMTYTEADCYCKKVGKRLPTEEEWEYAAVGKTGYQWPWGNSFVTGKVCFNSGTPCKVGSKGQTYQGMTVPMGFSDLVGNMREWTSSQFCVVLGPNSCVAGDQRKAQRGGSWDAPMTANSVQHRVGYTANNYFDNLGFRCAMDAQ